MLPDLTDLLSTAQVVDLPMTVPFRGLTRRETCLIEGPQGWTEFAPFVEYDDREASRWLNAAIEFGWQPAPASRLSEIRVNATVPAVAVDRVADILAAFPGSRTAKVKVAGPGTVLADDVARVAEVRRILGPEGRIRVDANGGWNLDEAEHAVHEFTRYDLEYIEQPCSGLDDLTELRRRIRYLGIGIAADEGLRRADDIDAVDLSEAADIVIVKAAPLGGIAAALAVVERIGLPAVVSSALETSVGLSMGAHLAAALPSLEYDCGLGTGALLAADVTDEPLRPAEGTIPVRRVQVSRDLAARHAAAPDRLLWWQDRITRCHAVLEAARA